MGVTLTELGDTIVIATKNAGKVREFAHALGKLGKSTASLLDYPQIGDIVEDGDTFAQNARIKAKTAGDALGVPVLADDSGLRVAALNGEPGVYSARYAGEHASDGDNNAKLLHELTAVAAAKPGGIEALDKLPDGSALLSPAQFVCALTLYSPATGEFLEVEGTVDGFISDRPHGTGGFGYDPLFWLKSLNCGIAELTTDEKGRISHRGAALDKLISVLQQDPS